jgi:hypothetical protein
MRYQQVTIPVEYQHSVRNIFDHVQDLNLSVECCAQGSWDVTPLHDMRAPKANQATAAPHAFVRGHESRSVENSRGFAVSLLQHIRIKSQQLYWHSAQPSLK